LGDAEKRFDREHVTLQIVREIDEYRIVFAEDRLIGIDVLVGEVLIA
jgi:hypothetical protein